MFLELLSYCRASTMPSQLLQCPPLLLCWPWINAAELPC